MKKEIINRLTLFLSVFFGSLAFSSCSDDYDGPQYSVTGEWFIDESDDYQTKRTIKEFTSDGKYHGLQIIVGGTANISEIADGIYKMSDNKINAVYTTPFAAQHFSEMYKVNNADKYSLSLVIEGTGSSGVFHRIVETYNMQLGESRQCSISDPEFNAVSFVSYDENIATVDESGMIRAMKRGTAYIKMISAVGEAIIRVIVNDSDNLMDDFTKYIYGPIDKVLNDFGSHYVTFDMDNGLTSVFYNVYDDAVRAIQFNYLQREHVYNIMGTFQSRADLKSIIASFDQKYEKRPSTGELYHYYYAYVDGHLVRMLIDEEYYTFMYEVTPNAFEEYDGMVTLKADTFAKWFGFDLSDSDGLFMSTIDNELYRGLIMQYDEDTMDISRIQLVCRAGVEESDLRDWFEENYYVHNVSGLTVYALHQSFTRSEYYVMINTNPVTGSINVAYQKNY